jgi:hypothetical protein
MRCYAFEHLLRALCERPQPRPAVLQQCSSVSNTYTALACASPCCACRSASLTLAVECARQCLLFLMSRELCVLLCPPCMPIELVMPYLIRTPVAAAPRTLSAYKGLLCFTFLLRVFPQTH